MATDSEILTALASCSEIRNSISGAGATLRKYAAIARGLEGGDWRMLPAKADSFMRDAGGDSLCRHPMKIETANQKAERLYREMLAAAPQFQEEGK